MRRWTRSVSVITLDVVMSRAEASLQALVGRGKSADLFADCSLRCVLSVVIVAVFAVCG